MSIDQTERERILSKIEKCLRLSRSAEPHEASAALRQAQKLMEKYGVSMQEVDESAVASAQTITPDTWRKKIPLNHMYIVGIVQKAFGVQAMREGAWKNKMMIAYRYFGSAAQVQLAVYAHEVLWRASNAAWNDFRREYPHAAGTKGSRMGFLVGWLLKVESTVVRFAQGPEAEQARTAQKGAMMRYIGGNGEIKDAQTSEMKVNGRTFGAGEQAAEGFSLHRPVSGQKQRLIGN